MGKVNQDQISYKTYTKLPKQADKDPIPNTGWVAKCDLQGSPKPYY